MKLTVPNTVAWYSVGKSLATDTYPILKFIAPPILDKQTITGITQLGTSLFQNTRYKIPPRRPIVLAIVYPTVTVTFCKKIPLETNAMASDAAKKRELRKMLPGKYLR